MGRVLWLTGTIVVVVPSLGGLLLSCVLLLTGTVPVVVVVPTVWEEVGIGPVDRKHTYNFTYRKVWC